jgi:hypothetical protein
VYVTRNAGGDWKKISNSFPKDLWVSRVVASKHKKSRVYVTLNGYRWDDFTSYVYLSEDFGDTWKSISSNLPSSPVNVIREDSENMNILYLGTDNGAYVSFNRGASWEAFSEGLPNVAFHDIRVQPEAKDLVLGTHGRSIYIADISLLQQVSDETMNNLLVNSMEPIRASRRWGSSFSEWNDPYEPSVDIQFYSPSEGKAAISVFSEDGKELQQWKVDAVKGFNLSKYDVSLSEKGVKNLEKGGSKISKAQNGKYYLPKGNFVLEVSISGKSAKQNLEIK